MKGKLNKFKKLLCYLIVSIFVFGIGGELVSARQFGSRQLLGYRTFNVYPYRTTYNWFYPVDSPNEDAWCLNSTTPAPGNRDLPQSSASLIPAEKKQAVINVINAGKELNLEPGLKYYITQAAIWYVLYDINPSNGITSGYLYWVKANYGDAWNSLVSRENLNRSISNPLVTVNGTDYTMEEDSSDNTKLVSKDFNISADGINGNFTVRINDGSAATSCILYNGNCYSETTIPAHANFKIRIDKPNDPSGTVDASFTVTPINTPSVYDIDTYIGLSSYGVQNMAVLTSKSKNVSVSHQVKGNYVNNASLEIQKTDAETGEKVAGADLYIEDENGNRIGNYKSTAAGTANPSVSLPVGRYYLGESSQPAGYRYNSEKVEFNVTKNGDVYSILDKDGNPFPGAVPTVSFSNERIKIKFKKVDRDGNPIQGIKMKIVSYVDHQTLNRKYDDTMESSAEEDSVLCAYTDANGFLTVPCTGEDYTSNVRSDGEYTFGEQFHFGLDSDMVLVHEYCDNDSCQKYMKSNGKAASFDYSIDLYQSNYGGNVVVFNPNIQVSYAGTESNPIIVLNLINQYYLEISKVDVTSGKEIGGAHMYITDPSVVLTGNSENNMINDNIIDEWKSVDNFSHTFVGIEPGHKYRLTEETAPDGYDNTIVSNVNSIDFIMDENGNVTTYDIVTGEPISDLTGTNYHLLITNNYTHTVFSKISAVTGEEIEGAELKVCTKDAFNTALTSQGDGTKCEAFVNPVNNETVSWISEAGKSKTVEALPAGDYYLVETITPEGYIKQVNYRSFTVAGDGSISKVTMENHPTHLTIKKLNQVTKERVAGSTLQILNASDRSIAKGADGKELSWVSTTDGDWEIYAIPAGKYILVEKVVPEGYQDGMIVDGLTVTEYEFTVSDIAGDKNIEVGIEVLNAPNTGLSTLNLFAIGGLMVFAGYETIKIYRRKALND